MTPEQKIKWLILLVCCEWQKISLEINESNVDDLFEELYEKDEYYDAVDEVRCSGIETGLECEYSRHYESKAVAAQAPDGTWVGWTYWYGGGKHGESSAIDWIDSAYNVDCNEEEKMVLVREFRRLEEKQNETK